MPVSHHIYFVCVQSRDLPKCIFCSKCRNYLIRWSVNLWENVVNNNVHEINWIVENKLTSFPLGLSNYVSHWKWNVQKTFVLRLSKASYLIQSKVSIPIIINNIESVTIILVLCRNASIFIVIKHIGSSEPILVQNHSFGNNSICQGIVENALYEARNTSITLLNIYRFFVLWKHKCKKFR